jgi:polysaccharide biosynthesis protein VpsJ
MESGDQIRASLAKLEEWVVAHDYRAYDVFDGLSSPWAGLFTFGLPLPRRLWQQAVRRFPLNLRPILGIKPSQGSKAMGFFAQGYLRLHQITGNESDRVKMRSCLDWLVQHRCPEFKGNAWGNHFDYESRGGRIPRGTPTVVWTSLIGHAFLDAYDAYSSEQDLAVASGAAEFIAKELGWIDTGQDICLNYIPANGGRPVGGEHGIHNSNVLGAGLLARVHTHLPNPLYTQIAERAVKFTVRDQLPNGAWYYGSHPRWHWVDSFHTAYNLEAIDSYIQGSGDTKFQPSLQKGYKFFVDTFFEEDGRPRYYDYKTSPLDIQCASQAIQTLVNLHELDPRSLAIAEKVALWTIANMQDPTGFFYYRKYPMITNKTPTLHWGQSTMMAALAILLQHQHAASTRSMSKVTSSNP